MSEGGEKRDGDLPPSESPDQPESQGEKRLPGQARRVKVGEGFLSFDPASHFEGSDALFQRMAEATAALKADGTNPEIETDDGFLTTATTPTDDPDLIYHPYVSPQGTVLQSFQTDEQAVAQLAAGEAMDQKALERMAATSSASTNLPTRLTEQDMDAAMRVKAALAKKYPDLAVRPKNTTEDTLTRLTDAPDTTGEK